MCLPYSQPSRYPDCGFQEGASLTIGSPPAEASFRPLSRPLLIQAGRLTRWNGWSPSLHLLSPEGDISNCDIVSQERFAVVLRCAVPGAARHSTPSAPTACWAARVR